MRRAAARVGLHRARSSFGEWAAVVAGRREELALLYVSVGHDAMRRDAQLRLAWAAWAATAIHASPRGRAPRLRAAASFATAECFQLVRSSREFRQRFRRWRAAAADRRLWRLLARLVGYGVS